MAEKAKRTGKTHRGKYTMFGQSITSVLRTMGKMGMHHTTAVTFLAKHKVKGVSEATIRTGVDYGRNKNCARRYAVLTDAQTAALQAAIDAYAASKKAKGTA